MLSVWFRLHYWSLEGECTALQTHFDLGDAATPALAIIRENEKHIRGAIQVWATN